MEEHNREIFIFFVIIGYLIFGIVSFFCGKLLGSYFWLHVYFFGLLLGSILFIASLVVTIVFVIFSFKEKRFNILSIALLIFILFCSVGYIIQRNENRFYENELCKLRSEIIQYKEKNGAFPKSLSELEMPNENYKLFDYRIYRDHFYLNYQYITVTDIVDDEPMGEMNYTPCP